MGWGWGLALTIFREEKILWCLHVEVSSVLAFSVVSWFAVMMLQCFVEVFFDDPAVVHRYSCLHIVHIVNSGIVERAMFASQLWAVKVGGG